MKKFLIIILFSIVVSPIYSQNNKWTHTDILIQYRGLHKTSNSPDNTFSPKLDLGIYTRWNYKIKAPFSLNLGVGFNYSSYEKNDPDLDVFFIDFFKGLEEHYFNFHRVEQLNLEAPISLQYDFLNKESNTLGFIIGFTPQIALHSKAVGVSFEEALETRTSSIWVNEDRLGNLGFFDNFFNDFYWNAGISFSRKLENQKVLTIESGYEYSAKGKSNGLFLRSGFKF